MENLLETYKEEDDEEDKLSVAEPLPQETPETLEESARTTLETKAVVEPDSQLDPASEDLSSDDTNRSPKRQKIAEDDGASPKEETGNGDSVSGNGNGTPEASISKAAATATTAATSSKKSKKKSNNVWLTKTVRKGKKKNNKNGSSNGGHVEDMVMVAPVPRFPDKNDDSADMKICLSKVYKAEKVELSDDRMSAGSTKGYRMVRATRGVCEGSWYFEIKVEHLGETGHTRLGWSTEKGDLQAPVGYDGNSFGYRDIDGSKVHKALREKYGDEGYKEGDVIGFYINLPDGGLYAPTPPKMFLFKGQRCVDAPDPKDDPPRIVPASEISFFKNGVCQGVAFKDLFGGRYYPAASMYTLPNQPNCLVKFNFGPKFEFFPENFDGRPIPRPMIEVPYHGFDSHVESGAVEEKKQ